MEIRFDNCSNGNCDIIKPSIVKMLKKLNLNHKWIIQNHWKSNLDITTIGHVYLDLSRTTAFHEFFNPYSFINSINIFVGCISGNQLGNKARNKQLCSNY